MQRLDEWLEQGRELLRMSYTEICRKNEDRYHLQPLPFMFNPEIILYFYHFPVIIIELVAVQLFFT